MADEEIHDTCGIRSTFAQTLSSLGFSMYAVNIGLIFCMPTIVIGELAGKNSPIRLTESEASWFGSLYFITQPLGSLVSGFLQDWLGRKGALMLINIPQLTAWLILFFSTSTTHMFVSMALMGLSIGFIEAPILSYVGETTQPRLRSVFSSFLGIFYNIGFMIESFLGAAFPWRTMILYNTVGPLIALLAMAILPESPAWLVTKGRVRDAEKAYQWLRGWVSPEDVKLELDSLVRYVRDTQDQRSEFQLVANGEGNASVAMPSPKTKKSWNVLLEPEVLAAFQIAVIFFTVSPFPCLFAMRPFFVEILNSLDLPVKPHTVVALCGAITPMGAIMLGVLTKLMGKRKLSFLSMGVSIICSFGLGGYLHAGIHYPWIPVGLFFVSYFFGAIVLLLPWIILIELFPLRARSIGSGFCAGYAYVVYFLVTKTYYNLVSWVDVSGTCFLYGTVGLLGIVYLYLQLPETEGQALEDIERTLSERRSSKKKMSTKRETDLDLHLNVQDEERQTN